SKTITATTRPHSRPAWQQTSSISRCSAPWWCGRVTPSSLRLDARRLDDRMPLGDLGLVPGAERLRRLLLARRDFEAEIVEPLLHGRIGHGLDHGGVEPGDDVPGRALRRPEGVPERHVETGNAGLVNAGDVGRGRNPLAVSDRIGANLAGANLLHGIRGLVDDDVDLPRDEVVERRAGAAIGH